VRARDSSDDSDSGEGLSEISWGVQTVGSGERFGKLWPGGQQEAVGRGGKKNLKVTLKDVKAAMEETSRDVDGEAGLSEGERNGEFLESGTQGEKKVEEKELAEALAISNIPEVEVCTVLPGAKDISEGNVEVFGGKEGVIRRGI
jgi:hypothetical protein